MTSEAVMKLIEMALDELSANIESLVDSKLEAFKKDVTEDVAEKWRLP